jgi:hypothetical protein
LIIYLAVEGSHVGVIKNIRFEDAIIKTITFWGLFLSGRMGYLPANLSPWALILWRGDFTRMLQYLRGLEVRSCIYY